MKIRNNLVNPFADFLLTLELKGKQSRFRTRFIKLLNEQSQLIQDEFLMLLKEYGNLDEDGNPKTVEVDGQTRWDLKDEASWVKEVNELNAECLIVEGKDKKEMLEVVKDAVLNCDKVFSGREAMLYDEFCMIVEGEED